MTQETKALRLAAWLDAGKWPSYVPQESAAELRHQHARIAELEAHLAAVGAGGVEPLRKCLHQIAEPTPSAPLSHGRSGPWRDFMTDEHYLNEMGAAAQAKQGGV